MELVSGMFFVLIIELYSNCAAIRRHARKLHFRSSWEHIPELRCPHALDIKSHDPYYDAKAFRHLVEKSLAVLRCLEANRLQSFG